MCFCQTQHFEGTPGHKRYLLIMAQIQFYDSSAIDHRVEVSSILGHFINERYPKWMGTETPEMRRLRGEVYGALLNYREEARQAHLDGRPRNSAHLMSSEEENEVSPGQPLYHESSENWEPDIGSTKPAAEKTTPKTSEAITQTSQDKWITPMVQNAPLQKCPSRKRKRRSRAVGPMKRHCLSKRKLFHPKGVINDDDDSFSEISTTSSDDEDFAKRKRASKNIHIHLNLK